jgi:hypothetical protein
MLFGAILLGALLGAIVGKIQILLWSNLLYTSIFISFYFYRKNNTKKIDEAEVPEFQESQEFPESQGMDLPVDLQADSQDDLLEDSTDSTDSLAENTQQNENIETSTTFLNVIDNSAGSIQLIPAPQPQSPYFQKSDWDYLIRNAQDGGTNSILASHVLNKTAKILEYGNIQADEMKIQSEDVLITSQEMLKFVTEIRSIAKSARIVAFNLMMEASRQPAGSSGTIMVVAKEVALLAENTNKLTMSIEQSVANVSEVASNNQKKCIAVSSLFKQIDTELGQFKFIMSRIEELSISQCEKIKSFEQR